MSRRPKRLVSAFRAVDPRAKLFLQLAFVAAAYAHTVPRALIGLTLLGFGIIVLVGESPIGLIREFRWLWGLLALAPFIAGIQFTSAEFVIEDARRSGLASYRVLLVVLVSVAIVRTTPPRAAEAALRWAIPGRPGRLLGVGVGIVFRFLPVIRAEARRTRAAITLRGGAAAPLARRIQLLGIVTFVRLLARADRLADAMRMRCLAWNATVPTLALERRDWPVLAVGLGLLAWAVWPLLG